MAPVSRSQLWQLGAEPPRPLPLRPKRRAPGGEQGGSQGTWSGAAGAGSCPSPAPLPARNCRRAGASSLKTSEGRGGGPRERSRLPRPISGGGACGRAVNGERRPRRRARAGARAGALSPQRRVTARRSPGRAPGVATRTAPADDFSSASLDPCRAPHAGTRDAAPQRRAPRPPGAVPAVRCGVALRMAAPRYGPRCPALGDRRRPAAP